MVGACSLNGGVISLLGVASDNLQLQAVNGTAVVLITLVFLVSTTMTAPDWHLGRHSQRYHPLSIDSRAIVSAPASHHRHRMRTLATGASPTSSEFVSASGIYFQV